MRQIFWCTITTTNLGWQSWTCFTGTHGLFFLFWKKASLISGGLYYRRVNLEPLLPPLLKTTTDSLFAFKMCTVPAPFGGEFQQVNLVAPCFMLLKIFLLICISPPFFFGMYLIKILFSGKFHYSLNAPEKKLILSLLYLILVATLRLK
mmetsp:Transcript_45038/g.65840  ORF Transcript_45038/g.65840 Transcript_45038/m.65840 type:complete len:149 (-) Transcript_45038:96-542(-)